ncbi:MAG: O-antigen ligase family protein [Deltaproteobacteria bacterium]
MNKQEKIKPIHIYLFVCFSALFNLSTHLGLLFMLPVLFTGIATKSLKFNKLDTAIIIYTALCFLLYFTYEDNVLVGFKNFMVFVFMPVTFYFSARIINKKDVSDYLIIKVLLLALFFYVVNSFFRDPNGNFTLNLGSNLYYLIRSEQYMRTDVDYDFINGTNISLLIVTIPTLGMTLLRDKKLNMFLFLGLLFVSCVMLFTAASRTAIVAFAAIIVLYIYYTLNKKNGIRTLIGILVIMTVIGLILSQTDFTQTAIQRFQEKTLDAGADQLYGLGLRAIIWTFAFSELSTNFLGYGHKYFYDKYELTTHNELLGQLVATGFIPTIFYFFFIIRIVLMLMNIKRNEKDAISYLAIYLTALYGLIGLTENITVGNRGWMLLFFFVLGLTNTPKSKLQEKINESGKPALPNSS